jgi:DNA-binding NtrC family response regulator
VPATSPATVLCLDEDPLVRQALGSATADGTAQVTTLPAGSFSDGARFDLSACLAAIRQLKPVAILLRIDTPDMPQLELVRALGRDGDETPVIAIAQRGSMALTIAAIQAGAYDLLPKPLDIAKLKEALGRALASPQETAHMLADQVAGGDELTIIGESEGIVAIYKTIGRVAESSATILIVGESGTGKELVARVTHRASSRSQGPFLAVNCAAIPENLLESELFGHEKGAFTGALGRKLGKFERAEGGTLFLDEIGDMSLALQSKILRALQEREIERVGGKEKVRVDVRIMAATNRELQRDVRAGRFREDLLFRLAVVTLALPPLRERRGDITLLIDFFTRKFAAENRKTITAISRNLYELLDCHPWPGNVRQLRNALERAVIMCQGRTLLPEHLPPELLAVPESAAPAPPAGPLLPLEEVERRHIRTVLEATDWNMSRAADILGIHRNTLRRRAMELGLERSRRLHSNEALNPFGATTAEKQTSRDMLKDAQI